MKKHLIAALAFALAFSTHLLAQPGAVPAPAQAAASPAPEPPSSPTEAAQNAQPRGQPQYQLPPGTLLLPEAGVPKPTVDFVRWTASPSETFAIRLLYLVIVMGSFRLPGFYLSYLVWKRWRPSPTTLDGQWATWWAKTRERRALRFLLRLICSLEVVHPNASPSS